MAEEKAGKESGSRWGKLSGVAADQFLRSLISMGVTSAAPRVYRFLMDPTVSSDSATIRSADESVAVPPGFIEVMAEPRVFRRLGRIVVSEIKIYSGGNRFVDRWVDVPTQSGRFPLKGSRWDLIEEIEATKTTPSWAKWTAAGTALITYGLGLGFLGVKTTKISGRVIVAVQWEHGNWFEAIGVGAVAEVEEIRSTVAKLVAMSH
ncbi:MAG TPA: hypothetical protein VFM54_16515 [Micromonosporaceae bacterium]|nr:hypothetical protein [Micromonosporaceae bacterium]